MKNYSNQQRKQRRSSAKTQSVEQPLSANDVLKLINAVRPDFRDYYVVRFMTGMRSSEIHGLKHEHIDLDRNIIRVRELYTNGKSVPADSFCKRNIVMSQVTRGAFLRQIDMTKDKSEFVFCSSQGRPLNHIYVYRHIWLPLLESVGMPHCKCYQSRRTAVALWESEGKDRKWIQAQLGLEPSGIEMKHVLPATTTFEQLLADNLTELLSGENK
ncbi:tyrosine-type recombinase/integrase [Cardiobacteriaceae bacterium TAE3-ERU3]|nr:tyrosine-type recombinase/integrase [Cardiobacteriaceae bacterium TAE3-ERU3]